MFFQPQTDKYFTVRSANTFLAHNNSQLLVHVGYAFECFPEFTAKCTFIKDFWHI